MNHLQRSSYIALGATDKNSLAALKMRPTKRPNLWLCRIHAEIVAVFWFLAEWLALRIVSKVFLTAMGNYVKLVMNIINAL